MEAVSYQSRPDLRRPVLLGAFEGWNDAGDAATTAVEVLGRVWDARPFASLDPEDFYDFQYHRPQVTMDADGQRSIRWPATEFSHGTIPGLERDAVLLRGVEPSMRWRTYCRGVIDVVRDSGVELVVTLGALLAGRPHTRPIRITTASADPELRKQLRLSSSRYEGPTGIVGVLSQACQEAGIPAVSLWAWVPHYLKAAPSPTATLALLRRLEGLLEARMDLSDLEEASAAYDEQVAEAVAGDPDLETQVRELERQADSDDLDELPTGDELAAEVERFLADHRPEDDE